MEEKGNVVEIKKSNNFALTNPTLNPIQSTASQQEEIEKKKKKDVNFLLLILF